MSRIRVTKAKAQVFPHLNSDNLEIVKFGNIQLVAQKGIYQDGDFGVVVMNKMIVPDRLLEDYPYLSKTAQGYRVKEVTLRGEVSEGISLSLEALSKHYSQEVVEKVQEAEYGSDLSELLEMKEYEVPVPLEFAGQVAQIPADLKYSKHDLLQFGAFRTEFKDEEYVRVTEKLHGSQIIILFKAGNVYVTSKGLLDKGLYIKESEYNSYWKGFRQSSIQSFYDSLPEGFKEFTFAVYGEIVNVQKGFTYGTKQGEYPIYVFDIRLDGKEFLHHVELGKWGNLEFDQKEIKLVPLLFQGQFKDLNPYELVNNGKSVIDGQTIKEGIVIKPVFERYVERDRLQCKVISNDYDKKIKKKGLDDGN